LGDLSFCKAGVATKNLVIRIATYALRRGQILRVAQNDILF
jgi:hypothetical protein